MKKRAHAIAMPQRTVQVWLTALGIYLIMISVVSYMISKETISEKMATPIVYAILTLGMAVSGVIGKKKTYPGFSILYAAVSIVDVLIIMNYVLYDGVFVNAFAKMLCVLLGAGLSYIIVLIPEKKTGKRRYHS